MTSQTRDYNISWEQFNDAIEKFIDKSELFNLNWSIKNVETQPDVKYLSKRENISMKINNQTKTERIEDELEEDYKNILTDDGVYLGATGEIPDSVTFEYHVVYSYSYNVPVLYFSAWKQDGKLLSLENIWENVPLVHRDFLKYDKWSFITQQEHPILGRPYFLVHPCHTANLIMQLLMNVPDSKRDNLSYLTTWLTAVGPTVGLQLPLEFVIADYPSSIYK
ncbi:ubiquitin-like-conjugating enzyme ATG10 isoform X2 [Xenia sp. Carnegie-2017]|nr:ubiquitin-like-conjugating enzyme ATG10 isoform X2 [Xenia sp. Carnegie-2017]